MAIEVRVPTILRSYTDGQKVVSAAGDTLAGLLADLDASHPGLRDRLITPEGALHRFVNIYINDEDVRFLGALDAKVNDGDAVTILPAVAGGAPGLLMLAASAGHASFGASGPSIGASGPSIVTSSPSIVTSGPSIVTSGPSIGRSRPARIDRLEG